MRVLELIFRPATLLKKETLAQVFSCEFCEISKNTFLQNTSGRLLLFIVIEHLRMTACDVKFDL